MMHTVSCTMCNNSANLSFKLRWTYKFDSCKSCYTSDNAEKVYYFCCEKCLQKWVNKFVGHKHDWEWTMDQAFKLLKRTDITHEQRCNICKLTRWVKRRK